MTIPEEIKRQPQLEPRVNVEGSCENTAGQCSAASAIEALTVDRGTVSDTSAVATVSLHDYGCDLANIEDHNWRYCVRSGTFEVQVYDTAGSALPHLISRSDIIGKFLEERDYNYFDDGGKALQFAENWCVGVIVHLVRYIWYFIGGGRVCDLKRDEALNELRESERRMDCLRFDALPSEDQYVDALGIHALGLEEPIGFFPFPGRTELLRMALDIVNAHVAHLIQLDARPREKAELGGWD